MYVCEDPLYVTDGVTCITFFFFCSVLAMHELNFI